ncbi:hypothetical protein C4566_01505 [Candidatus Parcubacteria bacterium]|nr:MAG: hypothetical protein C4566_01505 [Candidatus Parcubacteria bacterium]
MKKLGIFSLILVLAIVLVVFLVKNMPQSTPQKQEITNNNLTNTTGIACNSDADCPISEECLANQVFRCSDDYPPVGEKICRCLYPNCQADSDCEDGYACQENAGDNFGKRCVLLEAGPDDNLDTVSDRGESLFDAVAVEAFVRAEAAKDTAVFSNCQADISVVQTGFDWEVVCDTSSGSLKLTLGAYGDLIEYSFE